MDPLELLTTLWPWIPLGLATGLLTTVVGLGGGMLLVLGLTVLVGPATALAVSAPGLLLGNLHRLWMDRASLDPRLARAFVIGALPGSFLGGLLAVGLPDAALRGVTLAAAGFALARELGWLVVTPGPRVIVPLAAASGALTATSGGGGLLLSPLLLSTGLRGAQLVATSAAAAVAVHFGRMAAYGLGGWFRPGTVTSCLLLAAAILAGNHLGQRLRNRLSERATTHLTHATLAISMALALIGLAA